MMRARARGAITAIALTALGINALAAGSAAATSRSSFALAGEARALELAIGAEGVTLGLALARADSKPSASGVGAGQCALLGDDPDPDDLPCNDATVDQSSVENPGTPGEKCAGVDVPAPLDSILTIDVACGSSDSALARGLPKTTNRGRVGEVTSELDVSGVIPQAEELKEQLINEIQEIIGEAPEEIETALDQLLDALDEGQGAQVIVGPATSNVSAKGNVLTVESTAAGTLVGVVGIPDLDDDGNPIPGSSRATEDGLIIVEVGTASSSVSVDRTKATSTADASAALVTVKVRDITKPKPTYVEISVAPGESVTILEGTPAESTISAATASTKEQEGSARAASNAVGLHLLKGIQGGIRLALGRTTAAASVRAAAPAPPAAPADRVLPATGGRDLSLLGIVLLVLATAAVAVRRRIAG